MIRESAFVDAIIGPSYHYGGLAAGNLLSEAHKGALSFPKKAALEGLDKLFHVHKCGFSQFVLPPLRKESDVLIARLGMSSFDRDFFVLNPYYLSSIYSAAAAWMANAATVTGTLDSLDSQLHITPANLVSCFHRHLDLTSMSSLLKELFLSSNLAVCHDAVDASFSDEGAANVISLSTQNGKSITVFIYGKEGQSRYASRFPERQSLEAFKWISRHHKLSADTVCFVPQNLDAIDAGVFHNDVIAFGLNNVLVIHEYAWKNQAAVIEALREQYQRCSSDTLLVFSILESELPLSDAVQSYFFNSQLLSHGWNQFRLLVPSRCKDFSNVQRVLSRMCDQLDLAVDYIDCEESIRNGGGPACLRLMIQDTQSIIDQLNSKYLINQELFESLRDVVDSLYPDQLYLEQLLDAGVRGQIEKAINAVYRCFE